MGKIDQEPIFELKKKDSSLLGYIKLISQSRFVKRPEFDYRPKEKIMDFYTIHFENTKRIFTS